ncbi:MAG: EamA family transporter [Candidatus Cloacimonetes bacterium]|nr:EamA family transporter [Candidatus Cloacimonadota bacterium]HOH47273.1 EamA family transporter [Candidatus Cloacimonadota bacterium]
MKFKSHLYCLLTICIWSSLELSGKLLGTEISPFAITAWRFIIGGAVIAPFAVRQMVHNKHSLDKSSLLSFGALGFLNVVVSMLLLQLAIYFGKASLTAMIVSMNPLFVSVFAIYILREKLSKLQIISLVVGIAGLGLIICAERDLGSGLYLNLPLGILFAILACVTFALYTVLTKRLVARHGNLITNSMSFLIGGILLALINLVIGKSMLFDPNLRSILLIIYLGLVVTGLAYVLYFEGMKQLSASRASIYFFLKPALASILAYLILQEKLGALQIAGMMLIMLALSRNMLLKKA